MLPERCARRACDTMRRRRMLELLRKMSPRMEFVVVTTICFSYFAVSSLLVLFSGVRYFELNTPALLRGMLLELLILSAAAVILRERGWRLEQLGLRFSWKAALAGVPLFVIYLLVYWIAATFVVNLFPAARAAWAFRFSVTAPFSIAFIFIVINSVFEEIAVTAYVMESLSSHGAGFAITASTLIRFVYHLYQGPVASLSILPLGLLFGALYWQRRTVWPLIVAHTIANVVAFATNPGHP